MTLITLTVWYGIRKVSTHMAEVTIGYSIVWCISLYGSRYKSIIVSMTGRTILTIVVVLPARGNAVCLMMVRLTVTGVADVLRIGGPI
jgi:hypothetical protein